MTPTRDKDETSEAPLSRRGAPRRPGFVVELSKVAKLVLPMVLTQLGPVAMMTRDLVFNGRIGAEAVAAAALAGRVYVLSVASGSVLAATASYAAQAFGVDNLSSVRRSGAWRCGRRCCYRSRSSRYKYAASRYCWHLAKRQTRSGLHSNTSRLAWGTAPVLSFLAIPTFMCAVNRPEPVLWITLMAIPMNALLVFLLIYGKLGLPRLELFGAGLATALVNCATVLAGWRFATLCRPFRDYHVLAQFWRFDWRLTQQFIVIGTPITMSLLLECGILSAAALLMGVISTKALAANQVIFQVAATLFMISSGISMAATVRVAQAVGRDDGGGFKRAARAAMLLPTVIVAMLTVAVIAARFKIAELLLGEPVDIADGTIGLAARLFLVYASTFISVAVYTNELGILRELNDTWVPLLYAEVAHWLIGFPLSYLLGLHCGLGATGVWIGLSIGAAAYAALLVVRFQLLASRLALLRHTERGV